MPKWIVCSLENKKLKGPRRFAVSAVAVPGKRLSPPKGYTVLECHSAQASSNFEAHYNAASRLHHRLGARAKGKSIFFSRKTYKPGTRRN